MIVIDKLCYQSKLRYENAGEKFAFAVITLCICVMSRSAAVAGIVLAATGILTVFYGGVPVFRYLKFLTSSLYSCLYALQLILTALAAVSCLYFLSFTTPVPDILDVLKKLHCPKILIELMLLIYRFIFVLLETASAISMSQDCRLGNKNYRTALKSFGMMGSVLMIRAISRSNRLYDAMEARCYDGTIHVLSESRPPKKKVILAIILFDGALFLFALWRRFYL